MCISCAIGTEAERKGSSLWTKMRRFGRFLDEALKKSQNEVVDLEMGPCMRKKNASVTSSSSSPSTSSVEVLASLPLLLVGASNAEKQLQTGSKETHNSTKQEDHPDCDKENMFSDLFEAKSSLESFLFRRRFSSKEFIAPKLLSTIPLQLVVELSKLQADADSLPVRCNSIENDPKNQKIKRRSKLSCKKSLKRSHSSSEALKVESESEPECLKNKRVMFADDYGKSLEHIRTIENLDEIGYESIDDYYDDGDLKEHENEREIIVTSLKGMRSFIPLHLPRYDLSQRQPRLELQKVLLTELKTYGMMIVGVVGVVNLSFQKEVTLRYTTDDWKKIHDTPLIHLEGSAGILPFYDKFCFEVHCQATEIEKEVTFCFRFKSAFGEFWDNNCGKNYSLKLKK